MSSHSDDDDPEYVVRSRIMYEDPRYPTLIIKGKNWIKGFALDKDTGNIRRICICYAHSSSECLCGAWDQEELEEL